MFETVQNCPTLLQQIAPTFSHTWGCATKTAVDARGHGAGAPQQPLCRAVVGVCRVTGFSTFCTRVTLSIPCFRRCIPFRTFSHIWHIVKSLTIPSLAFFECRWSALILMFLVIIPPSQVLRVLCGPAQIEGPGPRWGVL